LVQFKKSHSNQQIALLAGGRGFESPTEDILRLDTAK